MSLSKLFTTNNTIDNITINDNTVSIIGYVDRLESNKNYNSNNKFYKVIVNNSNGKRVQITAWNDNLPVLEVIHQINKIVQISNGCAKIPKLVSYNMGNVPFEITVGKNTTVKILGDYDGQNDLPIQNSTIIESSRKIGQKIRIEGYIKSNFSRFVHQKMNFFLGSIADLNGYKLEVKTSFDSSELGYKGDCISLTGIMEHYPPGPPCLSVMSENDIQINAKHEKATFEELLSCYRSHT